MKQAIVVRQDLNMPKGKLAAQVAHASLESALISDKKKVEEWRKNGSKKVVLKVKDLRELRKYLIDAKRAGLKVQLIKDAGNTFFKLPTITCLGIGPDEDKKMDEIVGDLKLL
ncbi:MAG: peptidyl-tRNA hydrolase [Candidatus Aenigmarchaeota archaeon]|nr:peptidyl-tRNA hydrolase [Candidatus Aenigmarchaeota archaeon]